MLKRNLLCSMIQISTFLRKYIRVFFRTCPSTTINTCSFISFETIPLWKKSVRSSISFFFSLLASLLAQNCFELVTLIIQYFFNMRLNEIRVSFLIQRKKNGEEKIKTKQKPHHYYRNLVSLISLNYSLHFCLHPPKRDQELFVVVRGKNRSDRT